MVESGLTPQDAVAAAGRLFFPDARKEQLMKDKIRQFILAEFLPGESADNLKDDTPLRTSGILDSMATLRLVSFVEEEFGIEVEAHEAGVENFDRIEDIAAFIKRKKAARA
jgi:acyl carrier protein